MSTRPYFSVVIPTYNRAEKLRSTLEAIINQSFSDFEVIVMDDGGKDITREMIVSLNDKRISYFRKENTGPLLTRADGAEKAKGEWIAFCDSDDLWRADYLQNMHRTTTTNSLDSVFSEYHVEGEQSPRISRLDSSGFFRGLVNSELGETYILHTDKFFLKLLEVQPIMISAFAIKRSFYEHIGGIDKSIEVIGSEDSDLTLRASALGRIAYKSKYSVVIGRGNDNVSSNYIRNLEGGTQILNKILTNGDVPKKYHRAIHSTIDRQLLEIAEQYYWARDLGLSLKNLKRTKLFSGRLARKLKLLGKLYFRSLQSLLLS